ncbi:MAG TPA: acetate/propionate family kinase [Solirubrobacterales bacterium]
MGVARVSAAGGEVLVVNAGSTSLKLDLVGEGGDSERVERFEDVDPARPRAIAHRVVHGGPRFRDPVLIDSAVREQIFETEELAPLHNARSLEEIDSAREALPGLPQVAVFDTGFHATMPPAAVAYAVPRRWREEWGVRRYGFHGISVAWSVERAGELVEDLADARLVVCHLGGGCSVSAVRAGESVDNSMGFSPLEGLPMATRSGSVDPDALLYLMRHRGLGTETLEHALNFESGLLGLAGHGGDMEAIEAAAADGDADALLATEVFAHRCAGAVAAMAAAAGGLDALVFTAGIGEGSAAVRERVCARLRFLGVALDPRRNAAAVPDCEVAVPSSSVRVLVVRAREELVIARAARELLGD